MSPREWIMIMLVALIVFLAILAFTLRKKNRCPPDYYAFFVIGLIWFPLGFALDNSPLWILGLIFIIAGLANKDKWKKNRTKWKNMSAEERMNSLIIMIVLIVLIIIGLILYFLNLRGII